MDAFQPLPFRAPFQQPQADQPAPVPFQPFPAPALAFPEVAQQPAHSHGGTLQRTLHPDVVPDLPERQEGEEADAEALDGQPEYADLSAQAEAFAPRKAGRTGRRRGEQVRELWGPVRTRLDRMAVGDCEAFTVEGRDERSVYQSANERWVKEAGKAFTVTTGLFVMSTHNTTVLVLITRTA